MIAVLGTLDTKAGEFAYLLEEIRNQGHPALMIDVGVLEDPPFKPDISAATVAEAGGSSLGRLRLNKDRGEAVQTMARGASIIISQLFADRKIDGVVGMGGAGGSSIFATAVENLPIGFPKLLVSTMASGDTRELVGTRDLMLMPAVTDIAGLNRINRRIFSLAAGAICGMAASSYDIATREKPLIAASMLGNSTPAVDVARKIFVEAGYEVLAFHAIGAGGRTMEALIGEGLIAGVFDITTSELTAEVVGAPTSAGSERLKAAGRLGIPQVVAPGCMDFAIFWSNASIPSEYRHRTLYQWNSITTLMRTTPEEGIRLGRILAERINACQGPVTVLVPADGLSLIGAPGQPFYSPETDAALIAALKEHLNPGIPLITVDAVLNDPLFARQAAETLLQMLSSANESDPVLEMEEEEAAYKAAPSES